MRKLGWIVIGGIFTAMIWIILALALPPVGEGTRYLFIELLGTNIVKGITGASNAIMLWGSIGFPQAMAVIFGTGITFLAIGVGFSRLVWPRLPGVKKKEVAVKTPLQDQLSAPELYAPKAAPKVEQKVEEKTA